MTSPDKAGARRQSARVARELKTIGLMIRLYCRRQHAAAGEKPPCAECRELEVYARARVHACRFLPDKPACSHCPVHCYKPEQRERVRQVMRFAGPRMLGRHPWLTLRHLLDARRPLSAEAAALQERLPRR